MKKEFLNPPDLPNWQQVFSQVVIVKGDVTRTIYVAGQVSVDQSWFGKTRFPWFSRDPASACSQGLNRPQLWIELIAMTETEVRRIVVFFYGLFMDDALLREKGMTPKDRRMAVVENFSLVIGARATLVPCPGRTVHGVLFSMTHSEVDRLYSDASVSVYRPEAVSARLADGSVISALCFNLPAPPSIDERNPQYSSRLRELADRIGLPAGYVSSIQ